MSITRISTTLSLIALLALSSSCSEEETAPVGKQATGKQSAQKTAKPAGNTAANTAPAAAAAGAWIGIKHQPADDEAAKDAGLTATTGALVTDVTDGGPGANAGVRDGDVIVAVNGKPVKDSIALISYLKGVKAGATVEMALWRDGSKKVLPVITAKRPG